MPWMTSARAAWPSAWIPASDGCTPAGPRGEDGAQERRAHGAAQPAEERGRGRGDSEGALLDAGHDRIGRAPLARDEAAAEDGGEPDEAEDLDRVPGVAVAAPDAGEHERGGGARALVDQVRRQTLAGERDLAHIARALRAQARRAVALLGEGLGGLGLPAGE
jgi:hypothetical protein